MTHLKKRILQQRNQEDYEESIANNDSEEFLRLIKENNGITIGSVKACKNAAETPDNFYLQKILERLQPDQFRKFLSESLSVNTVDEKNLEITPAKKAKTEPKSTKNSLVDEIIATWPFRLPQVVWEKKYCCKKDDKPMNPADAEKIWLNLFDIAEKFCNNKTLHDEIYAKIDDLACKDKQKDEKLEKKLKNMRQSVRLCFKRLIMVKSMVIKVERRDNKDQPTTYTFDQFCKKFSVPMPKASNFKGIGPAFANAFMQHLNSTVFEGTDFQCLKIDYQIDEQDNSESVDESIEESE